MTKLNQVNKIVIKMLNKP